MNYPRLVLAAISALITFFAWGFLTEGWLLRKDFAVSAALYRTSDLQMKYMPFGLASVLVALLAAVVLYAGWCGDASSAMKGLQFGLLMGVFVACIHPISNLVTMNMDTKLGLEIAASNALGWVLAGVVIGLLAAGAAACRGHPSREYGRTPRPTCGLPSIAQFGRTRQSGKRL